MHDLAKRMLTSTPSPTTAEELPGLGLTLPAAHAALLERYQLKTRNQLWHTLPDDGYIHAHLTWHFEQAQQLDALHQFLREETESGHNGWYDACDKLGQTANFVTDITRAWILAEAMYPENPSFAIALQCRYALIMTSLNSLAKNISPELMAALVQEGIWTPVQGLAYAVQIPNLGQRGSALQALVPHLPESLLPKVLEAAHSIPDGYSRYQALVALAPHVPELYSEALKAARSIPDGYKELMSQALVAVRSIPDERYRSEALVALAPHLPKELMSQALAAARLIEDGNYRSGALAKLTLHLLKGEQSKEITHAAKEALLQALEAARTTQDDSDRIAILGELAPYLPEASVLEGLEIARTIQPLTKRVKVLYKLIPRLPEILSEVLQIARDLPDVSDRANALIEIIPHLPNIFLETLQAAREIKDNFARAYALTRLVPYSLELLPEALEAARSVKSFGYITLLSNLIPFQPDLLPEALEAAREIKDVHIRSTIVSNLVPYAPEILPEIYEDIKTIPSDVPRAYALGQLVAQCNFETQMYSFWCEILHTLANRDRQDLLRNLPNLSRAIFTLGGEDAIAGVFEAIQDVGRWWR